MTLTLRLPADGLLGMARVAITIASLVTVAAAGARAQAPTFDVRVESTVAPKAEFASIAHLVSLDATRAIVLDDRTADVSPAGIQPPAAGRR